jgi:hypothetical protein
VIIAVIILGVTGKIGSDGLISVLAGIVGWTAARAGVSNARQDPAVIKIDSELLSKVAAQEASTAETNKDQVVSGLGNDVPEQPGAGAAKDEKK